MGELSLFSTLSCGIPARWKSGELMEPKYSNLIDLDKLFQLLNHQASARGLETEKLADIGKDPILLLKTREKKHGPNLLIAAGFHGDEAAGCWGILNFLETSSQDIFAESNLAFLPVVNPTGFRRNKRTNDWNEDPNRGFCHTVSRQPELSREGVVLMKNLSLLKSIAKDGFISLHEDVEQEKHFYLYTFENTIVPGTFSETLRSVETRFFEPYPDGTLEGGIVKDGIIFRHCDGSFEDLLFHEGVPWTAATEAPGLSDIGIRVEANASIITEFIKFVILEYN